MANEKDKYKAGGKRGSKATAGEKARLAQLKTERLIRDLQKEQDKVLTNQLDKMKVMQQFGTEDQATKAASVRLDGQIAQYQTDQTKLMNEIVKARQAGNVEAYKALKIALEENKIQLQLHTRQKEIADAIKASTSELDEWQKKMQSILEMAGALATDWRAIGVILGKAALTAGKEFKAWSQDLGMSMGQAAQLGKNIGIASIQSVAMGGSVKATKESAAALVTEFGSIGAVTSDLIADTAQLVDKYGVGADSAAKLMRQFKAAEGSTGRTAAETGEMVANMAKAANVPIGKVMEDMAGNSETFAKYTDGSVDQMAKMAISAKQLGLEMSTVAKISDNLLDIDSSMEAEMEASVLLGKQINMSKARELALAGKINEAASEAMKQLGGIAEFNEMDVYQKQAAAAAVGMSVGELQKAMQAQNDLKESTDAVSSILGDKVGPLMVGWASSAMDAASWATENADTLAAVGGAASNVVGFLAKGNLLESIKNGLLTARVAIMKLLGKGSGGSQGEGDGKPGPKSSGENPIMKGIAKIDIKKVLGGAAAMVLVAAAVFIFAKAVQEFMKVSWEAIGMAVVSMLALVGAVALLGVMMSSGVGAVAIIAGAAAMIIVATAMLILGHAIQAVATGFEMMGGMTTTLSELSETILTMVPIIPLMGLIGLGFAAMGFGMIPLIAGLALLTPLLPTLLALSAIGMGIGAMVGGDDEGGKGAGPGTETLIGEKLDRLIELTEKGTTIIMNGQKVGETALAAQRTYR
jgi:hypothetical protein